MHERSFGTMQLVHFSHTVVPQVIAVRQNLQFIGPYTKPDGFWVSDEDANVGWKGWCQDNDFALESLKYIHDVTLRDDSNVLILRSSEEVNDFTQEYRSNEERDAFDESMIDWKRVASEHNGLIITPYLWESRYKPSWYYGWDCASGCIWGGDRAVESIILRRLVPT
jgi:hypothetical protein